MVLQNDNKLYRAVWPEKKKPNFWKKSINGVKRISQAAFIDSNGLSVEYAATRSETEVVPIMRSAFSGHIISFTVKQCQEVSAIVRHLPSGRSEYHCEVHGNEKEKVLSDEQADYLAQEALVEYYDIK